jgi:hypothetical protein
MAEEGHGLLWRQPEDLLEVPDGNGTQSGMLFERDRVACDQVRVDSETHSDGSFYFFSRGFVPSGR